MANSGETDPSALLPEPDGARKPGERLRAARQASSLSLGDVANRLRMGVKQVEALERDDYASLPQGTFLRGFVRNYAKVVNLDADELITLLESSHASARPYKGPNIVVPTQNIPVASPSGAFAESGSRYAVVALVALLLGLAGWYWWAYIYVSAPRAVSPVAARPQSQTQTQPVAKAEARPDSATAAQPVSDSPAASSTALNGDNPSTLPTPAAQIALAAESVESADAAKAKRAEEAGSRGGRGVIGFTFSDKTWVEVIDGNGKTILNAHYKSGDAEEVIGRPPFSIVIGNAASTRMAYNGKEFDLAPHTKLTVARVKLK